MIQLPDELEQNLICVRCASIEGFDSTDNGLTLNCRRCGTAFDQNHLRKLHRQARDVVRFGYQYRCAYEHDVKNGRFGASHYLLSEPPPWLVWCGAAALSGIVGNAAYDFVKWLIKHINAERVAGENAKGAFNLQTDEDIEVFLKHLREFLSKDSTVDPRVQKICRHEQMTDPLITTHAIRKKLEHPDLSPEDLRSEIRQELEMVTNPDSVHAADWSGLFSNVPVGGNAQADLDNRRTPPLDPKVPD